MVARVDRNGRIAWSVDTGIADLDQVLPDVRNCVFVGKRPRVPDKLQEPVIAIVNNETGAIAMHSLWLVEN